MPNLSRDRHRARRTPSSSPRATPEPPTPRSIELPTYDVTRHHIPISKSSNLARIQYDTEFPVNVGPPLPPPEFSYRVRIADLSFGVFVRSEEPQKFYSPEWSMSFESDCYILFDDIESKLLRIRWGGHSEELSQNICIALRIIDSIEIIDECDILLTLTTPPSFETEFTNPPLDKKYHIIRKHFRVRRQSLLNPENDYQAIAAHSLVSPFASRTLKIRVWHQDLPRFLVMAGHPSASLPPISKLSSAEFNDTRYRGIFSASRLDEIRAWLRSWQTHDGRMSWSVAFQLEALMSNGQCNAMEILELRPRIDVLMRERGSSFTVDVLRHMGILLKLHHGRTTLALPIFEEAVQEVARARQESQQPQFIHKSGPNIHICAQVTVTPICKLLSGPIPELSNRVLRLFPDFHEYFLRVNFADEDRTTYRQSITVDYDQCIFPEVKRTLNEGVNIAGRHFEFLGYGNAALREHAFWFVAPFYDPVSKKRVDANSIRESLGDFVKDIRCPARLGARMAQTFTATEPSIRIQPGEVKPIPDIRPTIPNGLGIVSTILYSAFHGKGAGPIDVDEARISSIAKAILEAIEESFEEGLTCCLAYPKGLRVIQDVFLGYVEENGPIEEEDVIDVAEKVINAVEATGRVFTDGVGTISAALLDDVISELDRNRGYAGFRVKPSALQIRFQGYKGMVVLDHRLEGRQLCLRPSMSKFDAPDSSHLEIARAFSYPGAMYMNRPMIMHLDWLGTDKGRFLQLQKDAMEKADKAILFVKDAIGLLSEHSLGHAYSFGNLLMGLKNRQILDLDMVEEDNLAAFCKRVLQFSRAHVLREMKYHGRIPVPGSWTLVGVADEWESLEEDQIYACIQDPKWDEPRWVEGRVIVSRSPCIHPGDAHFAEAIGKPSEDSPFRKHSLPNVLVFSCKGKRPLASMLGGGDLDGDLFNIIVDEDLFPDAIISPAEYPDAERKKLDHDVTIADITDFVVEYINSDVVGLIGATHLIIADENGIQDPACVTLADLHAKAVDYPKSGTPVDISDMPRARKGSKMPDWNKGELRHGPPAEYYDSKRALGYLFRAIEEPKLSLPPAPEEIPLEQNRQSTVQGIPRPSTTPPTQQAPKHAIYQPPGLRASSTIGPKPSPAHHKNTAKPSTPPSQVPLSSDATSILSRMRSATEAAGHTLNLSSIDLKLEKTMQGAYNRYLLGLKYISVAQAISTPLREEEIVAGTIMTRSSHRRFRSNLMERMRFLTSRVVHELKDTINPPRNEQGFWDLEGRLLLAYAAFESASAAAYRNEWGASSFCLVALGMFCDTLMLMEGKDQEDNYVFVVRNSGEGEVELTAGAEMVDDMLDI